MWACAVGLQGEEEQEEKDSHADDRRDLLVRANSLYRQVTGRISVARVTRLTRSLRMMSGVPLGWGKSFSVPNGCCSLCP